MAPCGERRVTRFRGRADVSACCCSPSCKVLPAVLASAAAPPMGPPVPPKTDPNRTTTTGSTYPRVRPNHRIRRLRDVWT